MEQTTPLQLVSPDLLETVNAMSPEDVNIALAGIARASGMNEVRDQSMAADVDALAPFGDQLMEDASWQDIKGGDVITLEPLPTFSPNNKGNQIADDGGTGPGKDE